MIADKFIPPRPLNTAVLFLVFNRLDTTIEVFDAIRQAKPPRLYIAADGARESKTGEAEKVTTVRDFILKNIDWECEVKTLFRKENLGCKYAVSAAIDWFFEQEEMGIILEDDCLPSQSFFWFCEELLIRYEDDMRVWHIGGYSPPNLQGDSFSYNFSKFTHIWGWASWANRWEQYDVSLTKYLNNKRLLCDYDFFFRNYENSARAKILDSIVSAELDTWDYQWNFCVRINNGLSIRPKKNLVGNIGFGGDATHTVKNNNAMKLNVATELFFPLEHPDVMAIFKKDDVIFSRTCRNNGLWAQIIRKFKWW